MRKAVDAGVLRQSSRGFRLFFWSLLVLYAVMAASALHHMAGNAPAAAIRLLHRGATIRWAELESNKLQLFMLEEGGAREPVVVEKTGARSARVALARCRKCRQGAPGTVRNGVLVCSVCNARMPLLDGNGSSKACAAHQVVFSIEADGIQLQYSDVAAALEDLR
jgi:hypothetical protein